MIQLAICDDDKRDLTKTAGLIREWSLKPNKPEIKPESVNAVKNIMGIGISLSKYPNSHLQQDEMHS